MEKAHIAATSTKSPQGETTLCGLSLQRGDYTYEGQRIAAKANNRCQTCQDLDA